MVSRVFVLGALVVLSCVATGAAMTYICAVVLERRSVRTLIADLWVKTEEHREIARWPSAINLSYEVLSAIHSRTWVYVVGSSLYYAIFLCAAITITGGIADAQAAMANAAGTWINNEDDTAADVPFALVMFAPFLLVMWTVMSYVAWKAGEDLASELHTGKRATIVLLMAVALPIIVFVLGVLLPYDKAIVVALVSPFMPVLIALGTARDSLSGAALLLPLSMPSALWSLALGWGVATIYSHRTLTAMARLVEKTERMDVQRVRKRSVEVVEVTGVLIGICAWIILELPHEVSSSVTPSVRSAASAAR